MFIAPIVGATLIAAAATGPDIGNVIGAKIYLTVEQKSAAMQPLVRSATECIARGVATDPEFAHVATAEIGDLIVKSVPPCADRVRAMIRAYDDYFGQGSGVAFFRGPYLDLLPQAVNALVQRLRKD